MISAPTITENDLLDLVCVSVIVVDKLTDELVFVNKQVEISLESDKKELIRSKYYDVFYPSFTAMFKEESAQCSDTEIHTAMYYWSEKVIWEQISFRNIIWENGHEAILLTITDVTDVAKSEQEYWKLAYYDTLTDLPNAKKFDEDIRNLDNPEQVSLIYVAIEGLEIIHDLYGWAVRDHLLVSLRDWLMETNTKKVQFYRCDDAIAMMGPNSSGNRLEDRARQISERFSHPWTVPVNGSHIEMYCRAKIAVVEAKYVRNKTHSILLRTAQSPDKSNQGYVIYDEASDQKAQRSRELRNELIACINDDMEGFAVHYQPIVDARTMKWTGAEALCRWMSPSRGPISPIEFIEYAEMLGLINQLDYWVRNQALSYCSQLGFNKMSFYLDINVSPLEKIDEAFIEALSHIMEQKDFPPHKLILEITETQQMDFSEANLRGIEALHKAGILLSLDDFGTGYSTIESLIKLSAYTLKVDKFLTTGIESDTYRQYLMKTLIDLAHHLSMKVVVEGVETEQQIDLLTEYDADYLQGFYFSKPMSPTQFEENTYMFL